MNPYLQIARDHLTTAELKMLLAEREELRPDPMTEREKQIAALRERMEARKYKKRK